jgi:hypothetical protein
MKPGETVTLIERKIRGIPVLVTVERSDGDAWTVEGRTVPWLHYVRTPPKGSAVIHWLRCGEYLAIVAYGHPQLDVEPGMVVPKASS